MPRFSRDSGDVIDLPEMQRRGLITFPQPEEEIDEIDFTSSNSIGIEPVKSQKNDSSVTNFLSNVDSVSGATTSTQNSNINDDLLSFASIGASSPSKDFSEQNDAIKLVNDLKWRLENTEYKLEQLMERLTNIENRFT